MPKIHPNTGTPPRDGSILIGVELRNGSTPPVREARKWERWKPWDWGESDFDIVSFWRADGK